MLKFRQMGVIVSLLLVGCSDPEDPCDGSFYLVGASSTQTADAAKAEERWNMFTGENTVNIGPIGTCPVIVDNRSGTKNLGQYWPVARTIYIFPNSIRLSCGQTIDCERELFQSALMHEIGHSFGMHHLSDGVDGIMNRDSGKDWTVADRTECEEWGPCK